MAENGVIMPVSAKNNEMMYGGWCLGIGPFFVRWESKWGLRLVREPLLLREDLGREWKALLRTCSANVPGTVCVWVSASGVSATLPSASCVGLKIFGRADLCRDSAKQVNLMALAAPSVQKSE